MFKKSKKQETPPPTAPTVDEMLADMKSFEIAQPPAPAIASNVELEHALLTDPQHIALPTWWQVFDEYERKIRKLAVVDDTIDAHKKQLQSCQTELEKNSKKLRDGLHKQQSLIKEVSNQ